MLKIPDAKSCVPLHHSNGIVAGEGRSRSNQVLTFPIFLLGFDAPSHFVSGGREHSGCGCTWDRQQQQQCSLLWTKPRLLQRDVIVQVGKLPSGKVGDKFEAFVRITLGLYVPYQGLEERVTNR
ncbi:hypothetical protein INR49_012990, partial [Caranx melampygus]